MVDSCTAKPGYWQNHVKYILVINASSVLGERPSAATIEFNVRYHISPLNSNHVLCIISCQCYCIHFEMCNIFCWKIKVDNPCFNGLFYSSVSTLCIRNIWHCGTLTDWGRDKMAAIFQTTFWNGFSWMKMFEYRLKIHWSLFLRVKLRIFGIGSDNGLAPSRRQAIVWTNEG